jgi:hypothetical protein
MMFDYVVQTVVVTALLARSKVLGCSSRWRDLLPTSSSCLTFKYVFVDFGHRLLHDPVPATLRIVRVDVGVEPSNIIVFIQIACGADVDSEIESMFQINYVSSHTSGQPLASRCMVIWRDRRKEIEAAGFASHPVVVVEFVKDSQNCLSYNMFPKLVAHI